MNERVSYLHPVADSLWGQPCMAIHIQPDLGSLGQANLHQLQQRIAAQWPEPLHCAPSHALHVTIYPLVPVEGGFDKDAYWTQISGKVKEVMTELCQDARPLSLRFSRLKVTAVGIIAIAQEESGFIGRLRKSVVEALPPPPGLQHRHYDLIHTTLARFANSTPVSDKIAQKLETLPADVCIEVHQIKIFRETRFPCLAGDELASVPLSRTPDTH